MLTRLWRRSLLLYTCIIAYTRGVEIERINITEPRIRQYDIQYARIKTKLNFDIHSFVDVEWRNICKITVNNLNYKQNHFLLVTKIYLNESLYFYCLSSGFIKIE